MRIMSTVDVAGLEPDDLARPQAAAIGEREHHLDLEFVRHDEKTTGLARAHDQRQSLRLLEVIDLGGKIMPPQRHAEEELHARHDAVAIADADTALGQIQLKPADVVRGGSFR